MAILDDTSTVYDDDEEGDWIHSDYSGDDEDEAQRQQLGVGVLGPSRNGEFPPRVVRWLRRKHPHLLVTRRMATMKCAHRTAPVPVPELARPQIQDSPPLRSEKRKRRNDAAGAGAELETIESYDCNDSHDNGDLGESTGRKRQRLLGSSKSCHGRASAPAIIPRVECLAGLPANRDGACEVAQPPITITGHLSASEASASSVGPRRSQRIREKLGSSACVTNRR